jgi:hypothetical protein
MIKAESVRQSFQVKADESPSAALTLTGAPSDNVGSTLADAPSEDKVPVLNVATSSSGTPITFTVPTNPTTSAIAVNTHAVAAPTPSTFVTPYAFPASTTALEPTPSYAFSTALEPTPSENAFPLRLPDSFQQSETNQIEYGNMFEGGQNLSFTNLMAMPLDGNSGEGFSAWNTPQHMYNAAGNWGLDGTLPYAGPWGDTSNLAKDVAIVSEAISAVTLPIGGASTSAALPLPPIAESEVTLPLPPVTSAVSFPLPPVASEVAPGPNGAVSVEVEKVSPVAFEISKYADIRVVLKVNKVPAGDETISSEVQQKRTRKPTTRGEVTPLTTKDASLVKDVPLVLPEWFVLAQKYLEDGLDVDEWRNCVESWIAMEKELGLSEVGSVSSIVGIS